MDTKTGKIEMMNEMEALRRGMVPIDLEMATQKQAHNMQVSLNDRVSALGKILTEERKLRRDRSKYTPHVGKKQLAKIALRQAA